MSVTSFLVWHWQLIYTWNLIMGGAVVWEAKKVMVCTFASWWSLRGRFSRYWSCSRWCCCLWCRDDCIYALWDRSLTFLLFVFSHDPFTLQNWSLVETHIVMVSWNCLSPYMLQVQGVSIYQTLIIHPWFYHKMKFKF